MLSLFILPMIIGSLYWLLHKTQGKIGDPRSKYRRMRLFGVLILLLALLWLLAVITLLAGNPDYASRGGSSLAKIGFGTWISWGYIRLIWTPFERWSTENEDPNTNKSRSPVDIIRVWLGKLAKFLKLEKPELKPYQYSQQSPSQKSSKPKDSTPLDPMEEELLRYQDLLSRGVITNKEHDEMRRKTLGL